MNTPAVIAAKGATFADYWQLTKPRVQALIVFTAVAGIAYAAARTDIAPGLAALLAATVGIALAAAGAAVANCLFERHIDVKMARTLNRATAAGRVPPLPAATFSLALLGVGLTLLQVWTNTLTSMLTLATFVGYAFIYTLLLKRNTPQNIVIGGATGAMPPVLGWTAVTGTLDYQPLILFLIIFVWTPPHFWALALYRLDDYRRSKLPMLPVTHGQKFTRLHILLYSLILTAVALLPLATQMAGAIYALISIPANIFFMYLAWRVWKRPAPAVYRALFNYSGFYLLLVFSALMIDALALNLS